MLFIENSYLKEFESNIHKIESNNIILEQGVGVSYETDTPIAN